MFVIIRGSLYWSSAPLLNAVIARLLGSHLRPFQIVLRSAWSLLSVLINDFMYEDAESYALQLYGYNY